MSKSGLLNIVFKYKSKNETFENKMFHIIKTTRISLKNFFGTILTVVILLGIFLYCKETSGFSAMDY